MMLVTKCPNCHTVFKVVSDQLKISEGWVRCGQCNEIFDTTLNLREWDPKKPEDN
ncbi:MAG: zinc-ribbon domain-containing protein, partial [Burkholderiaceae bacterium]|nr:zinc-ribbon domain-containing protein [Burkholderiaceae bacterium]